VRGGSERGGGEEKSQGDDRDGDGGMGALVAGLNAEMARQTKGSSRRGAGRSAGGDPSRKRTSTGSARRASNGPKHR